MVTMCVADVRKA